MKISNQEIADKVVKAFEKQDWKHAVTESDLGCRYRVNSDPNGLRCAVGALIPDEKYLSEPTSIESAMVLAGYYVGEYDYNFVSGMQRAHDYSARRKNLESSRHSCLSYAESELGINLVIDLKKDMIAFFSRNGIDCSKY